jgi:SIR2-like protein
MTCRRRLLVWGADNSGMAEREESPYWRELVDSLVLEQCVLVVGSGLSNNAQNLPTWGDFVREVHSKVPTQGIPENQVDAYRLEFLAYAKRTHANEYREALASILGSESNVISPSHRLLTRLHFPAVITTNLDALLEDAFRRAHQQPVVIDEESKIATASLRRGPLIIKMHGSVGGDQQVLTIDEYQDFDVKRQAMKALVVAYLSQCRALVLGAGLTDANFQRIYGLIHRSLGGFQNPVYFIHDGIPEFVQKVWEPKNFRFIRVAHESLTEWLKELTDDVEARARRLSVPRAGVHEFAKENALDALAGVLDNYPELQSRYTAQIHVNDYKDFTEHWEETLYRPLREHVARWLPAPKRNLKLLYCGPGPHAPLLAVPNTDLERAVKQVTLADLHADIVERAERQVRAVHERLQNVRQVTLDLTFGAGAAFTERLRRVLNETRTVMEVADALSDTSKLADEILPARQFAAMRKQVTNDLGADRFDVVYSEMVGSFFATPGLMAFRTQLYRRFASASDAELQLAAERAVKLWQVFNDRMCRLHFEMALDLTKAGGVAVIAVDTEKQYDDPSRKTLRSFSTPEPKLPRRAGTRQLDHRQEYWRDHTHSFIARVAGRPVEDFLAHQHLVHVYAFERVSPRE